MELTLHNKKTTEIATNYFQTTRYNPQRKSHRKSQEHFRIVESFSFR